MRLIPILPATLVAVVGASLASAPAWAGSPVVIEGADEDARKAILDLLPDREAPESLFDAERIAEEAAARALAWLRSEGYYAAQVTPEAREDPPLARLIVTPGARFRFSAPSVTFGDLPPDSETSAAALLALNGLHTDAPARSESVLHAEANALAVLQQAGYANASASGRHVIVDHATQSVAVEFRLDAGARVRLGVVRAEPGDVFRAGFIDDLRNWELGAGYTPEALTRLRRDLTSTGAVSRAATRLEAPDANGISGIVLEIEPARRNAYELGLGYSTTEGLGLEAEWTRRNLTGRADSFSVSTTLGEIRQELSASLTRPHAAGLGHALTFGAGLRHEESEAFTRIGVSAFASVEASRRLEHGRSYGVSLSADRFDDLAGGVSDAYVLSSFLDLHRDTTGFSLDPRQGSVLDLRFEPSVSSGDATLGFARIVGDARRYESFGGDDRLTLAARVRAGWLEPISGSANDVPPDRRFYAGGGGSVRGYEYNSIYPKERDLLGLAPGGQGALEGALEARWRFNEHWGAAAFADGGTAFDDWRDAGDLSWGAGIGVRYDLGFAPLRVDIAFPLDEDERSANYALYISIGQAF